MNCRIALVNPKTNKEIKSKVVNIRYIDAETYVSKLNASIKSLMFWTITHINV